MRNRIMLLLTAAFAVLVAWNLKNILLNLPDEARQDAVYRILYFHAPAAMVGLTQLIEVGPMSGESNVFFWLRARGIDPTPGRVAALYRAAKASDHVLSKSEIRTVLSALPDPATAGAPAPERFRSS